MLFVASRPAVRVLIPLPSSQTLPLSASLPVRMQAQRSSLNQQVSLADHCLQAGTDNSLLEEAQKAHAEGKGPSVGTVLVQPNGAQLQEVGWAGSWRGWVGLEMSPSAAAARQMEGCSAVGQHSCRGCTGRGCSMCHAEAERTEEHVHIIQLWAPVRQPARSSWRAGITRSLTLLWFDAPLSFAGG